MIDPELQDEYDAREETRQQLADERRDAEHDYPGLRRKRHPRHKVRQRRIEFWKGMTGCQ